MPITFHLKSEANLVMTVHTGSTPEDEFVASYRSLYENDSFDPSMNRLMDLRRADVSKVGIGALNQLAELLQEQLKEVSENPKVAVIASEDIFFNLSRMYDVISDIVPLDVAIFHSAEDALAWLGLPADYLIDLDRDV